MDNYKTMASSTRKWILGFSAILAFWGVAPAQEPLSRYRNSLNNFTIDTDATYSGACGERVGVDMLTILSVPQLTFSLSDHSRITDEIVAKAQAKCSVANEIHLKSVVRFPNTYNESGKFETKHYLLSKSSNWKFTEVESPEHAFRNDNVVTISVPGRSEVSLGALLMTKDLQVRGIFHLQQGLDIPATFTGKFALVPRAHQSRDFTPRYIATGEWFSLGNQLHRCRVSKNGYPNWGTFEIYAQRASRMIVRNCMDANGSVGYAHDLAVPLVKEFETINWNHPATRLKYTKNTATEREFFKTFNPVIDGYRP